jgi:phytoene/squalene synthetase
MLRDTREDIAAGYFHIPSEYLAAKGIGSQDLDAIERLHYRLALECP